jgi:hypothetical protein
VILGQRQEHVSERYVAAERDAHADQPPDHRVAGLKQVPDQPDQPERQRPEQEPGGLRTVAPGHRHGEGG